MLSLITADSNSLEVNVSGRSAMGLAVAYNALNDNTNAKFKNAELENGNSIAIVAGVSASTGGAALSSVVAINRGSNSTSAQVDSLNAKQFN